MASHARESPPNFQSIQRLTDYPLTARLILSCTNSGQENTGFCLHNREKELAGVDSSGERGSSSRALGKESSQEKENNFVLGKAGSIASVPDYSSPLLTDPLPVPFPAGHFGQLSLSQQQPALPQRPAHSQVKDFWCSVNRQGPPSAASMPSPPLPATDLLGRCEILIASHGSLAHCLSRLTEISFSAANIITGGLDFKNSLSPVC